MTIPKRPTKRRRPAAPAARPRTRKRPAPPPEEPLAPAPLEPQESALAVSEASPEEHGITLSSPEPLFAARVPPPEAERPLPEYRRAIFFDVENTSRAQHIARMIDHLRIDRRGFRTEFVAVGNWRVIGHDTARLLAQHGAHLVHSAPSVGVRDWSDLRIAVAAGAWLASARPTDVIEIVSDVRAFDAVGDVAASLGITFRRLSYRTLAGAPAEEIAPPAPERGAGESHAPRSHAGEQRYRGRRRGRRGHGAAPPARAASPVLPAGPPRTSTATDGGRPGGEPHTAPHDEIVAVVRDLMRAAAGRAVSIDTVANALKSHGFSRPPGSPRLITRLRRIKEIEVSRSGMITLVSSDAGGDDAERREIAAIEAEEILPDTEGPEPGNEKIETPQPADGAPAGRRRRRRGGRRRGGRGRSRPID
jgi:hypothetical protein